MSSFNFRYLSNLYTADRPFGIGLRLGIYPERENCLLNIGHCSTICAYLIKFNKIIGADIDCQKLSSFMTK